MATALRTRPASASNDAAADAHARAHTTPPAGRWSIDPDRARVAFSGRAGVLAPTVSARFADVSGLVTVGPDARPARHGVRVEVDVTTMTTGNRAYDELVGAVDPFDAARFPVAVYESTRVRWTGSGADIEGRLTLRGITRAVALSASYDVGRAGDRMVVRAGGTVDREAFGLRFEVPGLGRLVPRRLRLEIDVDVVRAS